MDNLPDDFKAAAAKWVGAQELYSDLLERQCKAYDLDEIVLLSNQAEKALELVHEGRRDVYKIIKEWLNQQKP